MNFIDFVDAWAESDCFGFSFLAFLLASRFDGEGFLLSRRSSFTSLINILSSVTAVFFWLSLNLDIWVLFNVV